MKEGYAKSEKGDGGETDYSPSRASAPPPDGTGDNPPAYDSLGIQTNVCEIGWRYQGDVDELNSTFASVTLFENVGSAYWSGIPADGHVTVFRPSLLPASTYDPDADAQLLKSFSKGIFGTDEKAVVGVLGKRSLFQRWQICDAYKARYNKEFPAKLSKRLHRALFLKPIAYTAGDLHDAAYHYEEHTRTNADGSSTTVRHHRPIIRDIVEIVCSRTPDELKELSATYDTMHKTSMYNDVRMATSGKLNTLLSLLLTNPRSPFPIDEERLKVDVQRLAQCDGATEDKLFIVNLFGTQSAEYLKRLSLEYQTVTGKRMTDVIRSFFSNYNRDALLALHNCMFDRCSYFADVTREAMTRRDMNTLTRVVVCGCESDFGRVKEIYCERYNKQFEDGVHKHASGAVKHLLLSFAGSPKY